MIDAFLEINEIHKSIKEGIISRLLEFNRIWEEGSDEDIVTELAFCILTPQSRAKICWICLENLIEKDLLSEENRKGIIKELKGVRFPYKKADYLIELKRNFSSGENSSIRQAIKKFKGKKDARDWLVGNVKGLGYKEASHFLRNMGLGEDLAILDRHILKNLKLYGVIKEIPDSLSKSKYLEIEKRMQEFSKYLNIPMSHLDIVFWYKETGEIFK